MSPDQTCALQEGGNDQGMSVKPTSISSTTVWTCGQWSLTNGRPLITFGQWN